MLTGFQVATGGYITENGELLCERCFEDGDDFARPISNYELDEWQTSYSHDVEWWDGDVDETEKHEECEQALYDEAGHELREEYHFGHDGEDLGGLEQEPAR